MAEELKPSEMSEEAVEAGKPVGDFIAQVASAITVIFCFLTFYSMDDTVEKFIKGYETPYGIIIIVAGALCFVFASAVLWAKFLSKDFWLARSPGWVYMSTSAIILIVSILAMVFPYKQDPNYPAMVGTFFTGLFIAFGGLLKF